MARSTLVTLLVIAIGAAACGGTPQPRNDDLAPADLTGRTFLSVAVTERGAPRPLVGATQVRLDFQPDGMLGASAGCNSMGGTYRLDGTRLLFRSGGMTAMGCDPELHAQDEWLASFLVGGPAVAFAGNQIALSNGGVVIQLADVEVVDPDRPLVGTRWVVDGLRTGDLVAGVAAGATASIRIEQDGSTTVETGCNTGQTTATVDGDQVRFGEISLTRRACVGEETLELEPTVLEVLRAPSVTWSVHADQLTLDGGGAGLDLRAG